MIEGGADNSSENDEFGDPKSKGLESAEKFDTDAFEPGAIPDALFTQVRRISDLCFGHMHATTADPRYDYNAKYGVVAVILKNIHGSAVGFSLAVKDPKYERSAHIVQTAIHPDFQGRKLVGPLIARMERELVSRCFDYMTRYARVDNGYAEKIQKHYRNRIKASRTEPLSNGMMKFFQIELERSAQMKGTNVQ